MFVHTRYVFQILCLLAVVVIVTCLSIQLNLIDLFCEGGNARRCADCVVSLSQHCCFPFSPLHLYALVWHCYQWVFFSCGCCCWWNEAQHKAECSTQLSAALPLTRMCVCVCVYACLRVCTHILFFKRVRFFVTALFSSIPLHTTFTRFSLVSHVYYMNIVFVFFFGGCCSCSSFFLKPVSSCCCLYGVLLTQRLM